MLKTGRAFHTRVVNPSLFFRNQGTLTLNQIQSMAIGGPVRIGLRRAHKRAVPPHPTTDSERPHGGGEFDESLSGAARARALRAHMRAAHPAWLRAASVPCDEQSGRPRKHSVAATAFPSGVSPPATVATEAAGQRSPLNWKA